MNLYISSYFPMYFKVVVGLLVLSRLSNFTPSSVEIFILLAGVAIVITTHYGTRIDTQRRVYFNYLWLLGFKIGKRKKFDSMEHLCVEANEEIAAHNARVQYTDQADNEFFGFVKFSGEEKLQVIKSKDKQAVINKLVSISHKLNLRIIDYTREVPDEI